MSAKSALVPSLPPSAPSSSSFRSDEIRRRSLALFFVVSDRAIARAEEEAKEGGRGRPKQRQGQKRSTSSSTDSERALQLQQQTQTAATEQRGGCGERAASPSPSSKSSLASRSLARPLHFHTTRTHAHARSLLLTPPMGGRGRIGSQAATRSPSPLSLECTPHSPTTAGHGLSPSLIPLFFLLIQTMFILAARSAASTRPRPSLCLPGQRAEARP